MVTPVVSGTVSATVAVPDLEESALEIALILKLVAVSEDAMVKKPVGEIVVPDVLLPLTSHTTLVEKLPVPATFAENCCVFPLFSDMELGDMVTPITIPISELTVTVAVPDLEGSAIKVALMVKVVALSEDAIVKRPVDEIDVPDELLPLTDHVTTLLPARFVENCWVSPLLNVMELGVTIIVLSDNTVTSAVPYLLESIIEVALTVNFGEVSVEATDRTPVDEIDVAGELLSLTDQLTSEELPSTCALNR